MPEQPISTRSSRVARVERAYLASGGRRINSAAEPKIADDVASHDRYRVIQTTYPGVFFLFFCFALRFNILLSESHTVIMLLSSLRILGQRGPSIASRTFSTTSVASAAEVKSLGVIGAGQMVGNAPHTHIFLAKLD